MRMPECMCISACVCLTACMTLYVQCAYASVMRMAACICNCDMFESVICHDCHHEIIQRTVMSYIVLLSEVWKKNIFLNYITTSATKLFSICNISGKSS